MAGEKKMWTNGLFWCISTSQMDYAWCPTAPFQVLLRQRWREIPEFFSALMLWDRTGILGHLLQHAEWTALFKEHLKGGHTGLSWPILYSSLHYSNQKYRMNPDCTSSQLLQTTLALCSGASVTPQQLPGTQKPAARESKGDNVSLTTLMLTS